MSSASTPRAADLVVTASSAATAELSRTCASDRSTTTIPDRVD
ncbi:MULTISPECIES: hypothetical protein [Saccharothrix]|nr:hypothetical protein [Saccharothrix sp. CB00851]